MTDRHVDILIVGGGVAGAACAQELRVRGYGGSVTLATREQDAPYHRPPITKQHLIGSVDVGQIHVVEDGWWEEHDVELLTRTPVSELDPAGRTAKLGRDHTVSFGQALIATGARIRRLAVDGGTLQGIHYLRAPGNSKRLRAAAAGGGPVVIVGGSYIASEVAASLAGTGVRSTMVMLEDAPLETTLGAELAAIVAADLADRGVEVVGGETVARFDPSEEDERRIGSVVTESGRRFLAREVVVGVGAVPETSLAGYSGLALGRSGGFACDAMLRTASDAVFVAGDACDYASPLHGEQTRIEHEEVAIAQGTHVARNMIAAIAGEQLAPYVVVPHFWSELGDWLRIDYVGFGGPQEAQAATGDRAEQKLTVRFTHAGQLVGVASLNGAADLDAARAELSAGRAGSF